MLPTLPVSPETQSTVDVTARQVQHDDPSIHAQMQTTVELQHGTNAHSLYLSVSGLSQLFPLTHRGDPLHPPPPKKRHKDLSALKHNGTIEKSLFTVTNLGEKIQNSAKNIFINANL